MRVAYDGAGGSAAASAAALRARFSSGFGLIFTTSHVTAAASAITHAMKTTIPMRPRTVSTPK